MSLCYFEKMLSVDDINIATDLISLTLLEKLVAVMQFIFRQERFRLLIKIEWSMVAYLFWHSLDITVQMGLPLAGVLTGD